MKTKFLKLGLPLSALLLMTSCLGDTKTEISNENEFGVVKRDEASSKLYVETTSFPMSSAQISNEEKGTCGFVKYKLSSWDLIPGSNRVYAAERAEFTEKIDKITMRTDKDSEVNTYQTPLLRLNIPFVSGKLLDDNWLIQYATELKKGEDVRAVAYFDPNNQFDTPKDAGEKGDALDLMKDGKAIIDIRFEKIGAATSEIELPKQTVKYIAVSLESLRYNPSFKPNNTQGEGDRAVLSLKFRYLKKATAEGEKPQEEYYGRWANDVTAYSTFFVIYDNED